VDLYCSDDLSHSRQHGTSKRIWFKEKEEDFEKLKGKLENLRLNLGSSGDTYMEKKFLSIH
jgi:hypothetical protein